MKKMFLVAAGLCVLVGGAAFSEAKAQSVVVSPRGVTVRGPAVAAPRGCVMRDVRVRVNGVWVMRRQRVCN